MGSTIWYLQLCLLLAQIADWVSSSGDVSYIKIFSQPLVVINSFLAAKDLLEKRGAIYSGRPRFVLIAEL